MKTERIDNGRVSLCDDGVVEVVMDEGAKVERPDMEAVLAAHARLTEGPSVVLIDARPIATMTRAAQQYTARTASQRDIRGAAIVIDSPVSAMIGNFYLRLAKPDYPTRLFRDLAEARGWLLDKLEGEGGGQV